MMSDNNIYGDYRGVSWIGLRSLVLQLNTSKNITYTRIIYILFFNMSQDAPLEIATMVAKTTYYTHTHTYMYTRTYV